MEAIAIKSLSLSLLKFGGYVYRARIHVGHGGSELMVELGFVDGIN